MSSATTDPTLEALAPRSTALRSAALAGACLVVLLAAWFVPTLLRPAVGSPGAGTSVDFPDERRVVLVASVVPHGPGGVEVRGVEELPGARVVDSWLVEGTFVERTVEHGLTLTATADPTRTTALGYATALPGVGDATRLPRTVASGGAMTLVVVWEVDDCAAAAGRVPSVVSAARWGAVRVDYLHFSPSPGDQNPDDDDPCTP